MYWYWPNIYLKCKQYLDQWIKWKMHTFQKRKRVIKYIRSKKPYERYQVDLVELAKELNMKDRFKYLLTWVDHFSKYAWAIPIRNNEAVLVRNALAQVFISVYPKYLQSDNGKEFTNQTFESYLENIEVEHILGSPYHLKVKVPLRLLTRLFKERYQLLMIT